MPITQRELLLNTAHCPTAHNTLARLSAGDSEDHPLLPCGKICNYQREQFGDEFTTDKFHAPEPWNGNLDTAEILFISSNPNIDVNEKFPTLTGERWSDDDDDVEKFFINRLHSDDYHNPYWTSIMKCAAYILGETPSVGSLNIIEQHKLENSIADRVAVTEVVHCKSEEEIGVKEAAHTCFHTHTTSIINYFLNNQSEPAHQKTLVFVGAQSRNRIYELVADKKYDPDRVDDDMLYTKTATYFRNRAHAQPRIIFIQHPNGRGVRDAQRQEKIDEFLERSRRGCDS